MRLSSLILILSLSSQIAGAALGGKVQSPQMRVMQKERYNLHVQSQPKLDYREFETNGQVFAISWSGKNHPNMSQVMGSNFKNFESALEKAKKNHHGHGPLRAEYENLHVELGGTMGMVLGRAWLIDQVPNGVDTHELH